MQEYYNDIEPFVCQWMQNLQRENHIGAGFIDARSIKHVGNIDFSQYERCHFFAGIAVWSYALRVAGWPEAWPVWTGSCPCQPFSGAGKRKAFNDDRHLWPDWFRLIERERPFVVLGEQVASPDGYAWLDTVQTDLENAGYACGAVVTPAAGYGAPEERHRIYWMAHADHARSQGRCERGDGSGERIAGAGSVVGGLGNTSRDEQRQSQQPETSREQQVSSGRSGFSGGSPGPLNGFWRAADWLFCRDGKWRPVEPGTFPLVDGASNRVGQLRAYGNAIVATQAVEFIKAVMEVINEHTK